MILASSETSHKTVRIDIQDGIGRKADGSGVASGDVVKTLAAAGPHIEAIDVHINTAGGNAYEGVAIYNTLKNHPAIVRVYVDGIAASAGSIIAMAGDEIHMPESAQLMIHGPKLGAYGGRQQFEDAIKSYDNMRASMLGIYSARSGQPEDVISSLMDRDSFLTAKEAKALGLITHIIPNVRASIEGLDLSIFGGVVPPQIAALVKQSEQPVDPEEKGKPNPMSDSKTISADMLAQYTTEFGAVDAVAYIQAGLDYPAALTKHVGKLNASLAAKDQTIEGLNASLAAKDKEIADVKAQLAAVEVPGETTPVPNDPAKDGDDKAPKCMADLVKIK